MEESAKRREKLKAMRLEASQDTGGGAAASPLLNPLLHPPPAAVESSPPAPRFDFYTDPMAAFSSAKRKSGAGVAGGGYNPSYSPTPPPTRPNVGPRNVHPHQLQVITSPAPSSYEMSPRAPYGSQWRSPVQFHTPFSGHQGTPVGGQGSWSGQGSSFGRGFPPNSSRGGFSSPHFGWGSSPIRSPGIMRGSPHLNSGRGRGRFSDSPSPGSSGSWGRGSYRHSSGRPESAGHYYHKSMVKDPWRKLKPIVGNILVPRAGPESWLPKSLIAKKPKVAGSGKELMSSPQLSLAEYLAQSMEEAVNET